MQIYIEDSLRIRMWHSFRLRYTTTYVSGTRIKDAAAVPIDRLSN